MDSPDMQRNDDKLAPARSKRSRWLGFLAAVVLHPSRRRCGPIGSADLKRHDYPASTQRLGFRFSERIRAAFRYRWMKRMD